MPADTPQVAKYISQANAHARAHAASSTEDAAAEFARGLPVLLSAGDRARVLEHYARVHHAITAETEDLTGVAEATAGPAEAGRMVERAVRQLGEAQALFSELRTSQAWTSLAEEARAHARHRLVTALRDANTQLMLLVQSEAERARTRTPRPRK